MEIAFRVQIRQLDYRNGITDIQRTDLNLNPNCHCPDFAPDLTFPHLEVRLRCHFARI